MAFEARQTDELVRIAAAGAGFRLNASTRLSEDLVRVSAAAEKGGGHVTFIGMHNRPTDDLVHIAEAGRGHISFED